MSNTELSTATSASQPQAISRGRRGGHRGHRRGAGGRPDSVRPIRPPSPAQNASRDNIHTAGRRTFDGQLTQPQLDVHASPFIPASLAPVKNRSSEASANGSQSKAAPRSSARLPPRRPRRASRSQASDLATRLHEDIGNGIYECAICANEVSRNSKVWSCHTCWTVFHIGCIKKWSKNEGAAVQQRQAVAEGAEPLAKQWRCPGCNLPQDTFPTAYNCWCEKELDPKVVNGLPPHSCGQTCGKDRKFPKACPHPCDRVCHAGPCPPCASMGPKQSCFCGRQETTRRCADTEYTVGWSCGAVCGDTMPCGEHACSKPCHEGLCGACEIQVAAKCYCGKQEQSLMCSERDEEKLSHDWIGVFDCQQTCGRLMDCGIHQCQKTCHPQDEETAHCPRSPDVVTHCPCGKTSLESMGAKTRTSCTDPILSCKEPCGKPQPCGHPCLQQCHTGYCPPCMVPVPLTCRCGRNKFQITCCGTPPEPPHCFRVCKATLNCGRHECGERCCPGERKAAERQATKRKLKPLGAARVLDDGIEAEHICTRVCGRPLKCGNHTCPELCHKGPCGSCREAIFDEITCHCGRTVLQPPLPCGTRPPSCTFPCDRSKSCGHPQVVHNCHTDGEECPKCPFLTQKQCLCGKKMLKNQPCWRSEVLCGLVCGKTLKCGSHTCRKTCHKPGECEDADVHCGQECGKSKRSCGHPCEQPCHAPSSCKEDKPCPFKVFITCDCQRKKEEVRCNARVNNPEAPGRQTSLKCDDECARLERNRTLKAALHISDDHTDDHVPYSAETLNLYLADVAWAHQQEEILRLFAADDDEKRYRFPPMKPRQRAFIHSVAEDFGFDGESLDPEPHRHVVLFKTPKFVAAPMKTLQQAARIRRTQFSMPQAAVPDRAVNDNRADEAVPNEWNGLLLRNPRFALTVDELQPILQSSAPGAEFDIFFLTFTDAVAFISTLASGGDTSQVSSLMHTSLPAVSSAMIKAKFGSGVVLAKFDLSTSLPEPSILSQSDSATAGGGWSQVAAGRGIPAGAKQPQLPSMVQKNTFTVLGSRLAEAKKRKAEEKQLARMRAELERDTVDDWSAQAEAEEEAEKETDSVGG